LSSIGDSFRNFRTFKIRYAKLNYFATAENRAWNTCKERFVSVFSLVLERVRPMMRSVFNGWGAVRMPKRFWAFLFGTEDAVPGDYVLALVATIGLMLAILAGMA
jgi:hypothetical protein